MGFLFCSLLAASVISAHAQSNPTGTISGRVGNAQTKVFLQGVMVELPLLHKQALTDNDGRFTLIDIPAGDYQLVTSYIGLDTQYTPVHVDAGQRADVAINLTSTVYNLSALTVTGIREGNARAITIQRTAPNLEKVQALDALGNLPNDNAGELLVRLPGVSANLDAENNIQGVQIRGSPDNLVSFYIDGDEEASPGGQGRVFQTHSISGALFDSIEVVPAPTPDMSADSIAGAVLFNTRDPLSIEGDYELSYRVADRVQGWIDSETPSGKAHEQHPFLSANYDGVYDVAGGKRNLGVSFSAFYSENATGYDESGNNLYQQSLAEPAYMYQYQTIDGYNNRKQTSFDLKSEYRVSDHMEITFNALYNDAFEPYNPVYTATAATGQTVATLVNGVPTGTGGIMPGYTDYVTQVLPVASSKMTLNSTQYSFIDRQREYSIGAKNDFDRLHLDYHLNYNYAHPNLGNGKGNGNESGGIFTESVANIGYLVDQTHSAIYPNFIQDAGPSVTNGANYGSGLFTTRDNHRDTDKFTARLNATYDLPTTFTSSIKAGYNFEETTYKNVANMYEWTYAGTAPLSTFANPSLLTFDEQREGFTLPFVNTTNIAEQIANNPTAWNQNLYYHYQQDYIGTNTVQETIKAAYVQAQAKFGPVDFMTGVRMENTGEYGFGYVASPVLSTAAQQLANPLGSAMADYTANVTNGGYTNFFPGVYTTYHITSDLQARGDFSTSIGRPTAADIIPAQTANTSAGTLTIANPSLKPEYARNFDFDVEYYFQHVGKLTAGWFYKDITSYIATGNIGTVGTGINNGYNGNYQGDMILTNTNAGTAIVDGYEFEYTERFDFLPGPFAGLGMSANYTQLQTHGNYGGSVVEGANQLAAFVPKTGNLGLNYNWGAFGARALINYTGRYLNTASTNAAVELYRYTRTIANFGISYQIVRACTLSVDVTNLFNEPQGEYYGVPTRRGLTIVDYPNIVFGVNGKF